MNSFPTKTMVSFGPEVILGQNSYLIKDLLLQVSRRLDWRFLLPDPDLDCVAYIGLEKDPLVEALRLFSRTLTQIEPAEVEFHAVNEFDLVVVKNPSIQSLTLGAKLVKPSGYIYIEGYGWSRLIHPRKFGRFCLDLLRHGRSSIHHWLPTGCRALIQKYGFQSVETYWHWPTLDASTRMIRIDHADPFAVAYSFQDHGIQLLVKKSLSNGLLPADWVQYCVPYFSIIARKDSL